MTRDETRAMCILAMARTAYHAMALRMVYRHGANLNLDLFDAQPEALKEDWIASQTGAFDALNGVARIVPVWATDGMAAAGVLHRENTQGGLAETFDIMAAVGDLTNAPGG